MMLDIDHFKRVNDTYGHQLGDEALRVVAETVRKTIRKTDIAGRYGGEELLVLAPGDASSEKAEILAQRLNKAIKAAAIELKNGKTISITVSIGVSSFAPERKSAAALIKSADKALYQAKETGRDRVCISK
jgi:diguanylate cyclase (GGDEF)-like protein